MATENLSVVHKKISTAAFDVKNRVLYLPMLNWKAGSSVYDLFCCHEVGHALFTPEEGWHSRVSERGAGYKSFLNVLEDARIEKKIKRRYPGAKNSMHQGYSELNARDFFGIAAIDDVQQLGLIDRINLHFKLGTIFNIGFSEEEMEWVSKIEKLETFDEVLELCDSLYEYCKDNEQQLNFDSMDFADYSSDDDSDNYEEASDMNQRSAENGSTEEQGMRTKTSEHSEAEGDAEDGGDDRQEKNGSGKGGDDRESNEPFSYTDNKFRQNETDIVNMDESVTEPLYIQYKDFAVDRFVVDFSKVHHELSRYFESSNMQNAMSHAYLTFRKSNEKIVNYLVKEFEMRKSAQQYKRAYPSKKGTLDMNKIHMYKFNDQIFNQVMNFSDGKNHGLMFFLDWSGSMQNSIKNTVEQLMNLVMFCSKINIPFEVYAFTDGYDLAYRDWIGMEKEYVFYDDRQVMINPRLRLLNFFSSRMSKRQLQQAYRNVLMLAHANCEYHYSSAETGYISIAPPSGYVLSGTPLSCTVLLSRTLLKQFISNNKLENVNAVFLTDGASNHFSRYYDKTGKTDIPYNHYRGEVFLEDKETRNVIQLKGDGIRNAYHWDSTNMREFVQFVKKSLGINVLGFHLVASARNLRVDMNLFSQETLSDADVEKFRKNKYIVFPKGKTYYDELYIIQSSSLEIDDKNHFSDVQQGAKKSEVRKALRKNTTGKLKNRMMLNKFIEKIA